MLYSENLLEGNRSICSFVASHKLRPDENVARNVRFSANFSNGSFSVDQFHIEKTKDPLNFYTS